MRTYLGVVWDSTTMQARLCPARFESSSRQSRGWKKEWSPSHVAHQLPGDAGRVSSIKYFLPELRNRHVLTRTGNTAVVSYINQRRSAFAPPVQAGAPNSWVVPGQTPLAENSSYSWASKYGSRHPVEAVVEARGMDASPWGGEADLESLARLRWTCLWLEGHRNVPSGSLWPIQLHGGWMPGYRCGRGFVCTLFPDCSALGSSAESCRMGKSAPFWLGRVCSDLISLLDGSLFPFWSYPPLSGCYFIASSPLISPLLGGQGSLSRGWPSGRGPRLL